MNPKELRARPRTPLIVNRTGTTLDMSHFPMHLKGGTATHFAVYCKPFGAGVELSINATTAQYDGTGTLVPIGDRVTIKGLQPNDTYMIAIAAYDAKGRLIGELGTTCSVCSLRRNQAFPVLECCAHTRQCHVLYFL